jgi:hypothetical protein
LHSFTPVLFKVFFATNLLLVMSVIFNILIQSAINVQFYS